MVAMEPVEESALCADIEHILSLCPPDGWPLNITSGFRMTLVYDICDHLLSSKGYHHARTTQNAAILYTQLLSLLLKWLNNITTLRRPTL